MDFAETLRGLIFFGSGDFANLVLKYFLKKGIKFDAVVTIPPRPKGRGRRLLDPDVKKTAASAGIKVLQPEDPNREDFLEELKKLTPDFILLSDYGKILKRGLLSLPGFYPLNIHPSLLPAYRGAAPIERAMMNCEKLTGVSLMVMDEGLDTGPIVDQVRVDIGEEEVKTELMERLARLGVELTIKNIEPLKKGERRPVPQSGAPSYASKIKKEELYISWEDEALKIKCRINALSYRPGARGKLGDLELKLLRARLSDRRGGRPGRIHTEGERLFVEAKDLQVEILELQPPGKRIMSTRDFLRGYGRKLQTV